MAGAPFGATVTLSYDLDGTEWPDPREDDILVSFSRQTGSATDTCYLILSVRRVRSTVHPRRFSLRCTKLSLEEAGKVADEQTMVFPLFWYPRRRNVRRRR